MRFLLRWLSIYVNHLKNVPSHLFLFQIMFSYLHNFMLPYFNLRVLVRHYLSQRWPLEDLFPGFMLL